MADYRKVLLGPDLFRTSARCMCGKFLSLFLLCFFNLFFNLFFLTNYRNSVGRGLGVLCTLGFKLPFYFILKILLFELNTTRSSLWFPYIFLENFSRTIRSSTSSGIVFLFVFIRVFFSMICNYPQIFHRNLVPALRSGIFVELRMAWLLTCSYVLKYA